MFDNFMAMIRKRRRTDNGSVATDSAAAGDVAFGQGFNNFGDAATTNTNSTTFWHSLFHHQQQQQQQQHQEHQQLDRPVDLNERFVTAMDIMDAQVEKFRKEAMGLLETRDYLLMSMDLIKSNDHLQNMPECEREEIHTYIKRVNSRLSTVELHVHTVRDCSQEESLSQVNALIDMMIKLGDPVLSRQRCQQYLNACCSSAEAGGHLGEHHSEANVYVHESYGMNADGMETDLGPVDKKFESVLLGCTLDDQKIVKRRLQALMNYLNKQTPHKDEKELTTK